MKPHMHSLDEEELEEELEDEEELLEARGRTGWQGTGLWGLRSGMRSPLEHEEEEEELESSDEEEDEVEEEEEDSLLQRLHWGALPWTGF